MLIRAIENYGKPPETPSKHSLLRQRPRQDKSKPVSARSRREEAPSTPRIESVRIGTASPTANGHPTFSTTAPASRRTLAKRLAARYSRLASCSMFLRSYAASTRVNLRRPCLPPINKPTRARAHSCARTTVIATSLFSLRVGEMWTVTCGRTTSALSLKLALVASILSFPTCRRLRRVSR